ncbi:hypothetical protein BGZ47_009905 [Haplosporangium gracile]|nr:hypothetical protein BGZ47_009905 [Haplosporangium gracile]
MSYSTPSPRPSLRPRGGGRRMALMSIGNTGVGKSELLNQLRGNFKSGFSERHGAMINITIKTVDLQGETVVLMDVPGLIEPEKEATDRNVNKCLLKIDMLQSQDGAARGEELYDDSDEKNEPPPCPMISFCIIVDGIPGQRLYETYALYVDDKFRSFFADNGTEATPFDIRVGGVLLLRADDDAVASGGFREQLTEFVRE